MTTVATKKKIHQYSEESLANAPRDIREGNRGVREASREYGVPIATLQDRLHDRVKEKPRQMGPDPILSAHEENRLQEWILNMAKCGFPRKKEVVRYSEGDNKIRQTRESIQRWPGQKWYQSCLRRHPQIVERTAEGVDKGWPRLQKNLLDSGLEN